MKNKQGLVVTLISSEDKADVVADELVEIGGGVAGVPEVERGGAGVAAASSTPATYSHVQRGVA